MSTPDALGGAPGVGIETDPDPRGAPVYRSFDQRTLDRQYSPSSRVPDIGVYLRDYADRSAAARERLAGRIGMRYGPRPEQLFDYFPAAGTGGPLLVYVHGGYWQEISRRESAFMAADFVAQGVSVAVLGYGLAPRYRLPQIVAMVADGVRWLDRNRADLPGAPGPMHLSGSSAGAHLVAMTLLDVANRRRPGGRVGAAIAGAVLLSGVYDLEPVRLTYVNAPLGLDAATARACSPQHRLLRAGPDLPPLVVALGQDETDEFARQHAEFAAAVRARGGRVDDFVVPGRNHFDLPFSLGCRETMLGAAVARLIHGPDGSVSRRVIQDEPECGNASRLTSGTILRREDPE